MALKTGGQAVVDSLLNEGVSQAFGVISVHTVDIYDALFGARDRLKFVGGRHESAVTYMADGYSRASGRPGVCLTSTGPGAANSIGAMGEAYQCSSAVLNIASNCESDLINSLRGALHEPKDQLGMFRSVTAWNALVTSTRPFSPSCPADPGRSSSSFPLMSLAALPRSGLLPPPNAFPFPGPPRTSNGPPACWHKPNVPCSGLGPELSPPTRRLSL
jgi:hypothetical protein